MNKPVLGSLSPGSLAAIVGIALALPAHAALQDEIQVYTDDINAPREKSLEVHVNTTPSTRNQGAYEGESINRHGLRVTPEFAWGLTRTLEAGLYLPLVRDAGGDLRLAGAKLRLKWLPLQPAETPDGVKVGWYAGVNVELARVAYRYDPARTAVELRNIVGWRGEQWSFVVNPIFGFGLSEGYRNAPDFDLNTRVMRNLSAQTQAGFEFYDAVGRIGAAERFGQRDKRLFAVGEHEFENGFGLHFGVGRGFGGADAWTVKAIVSVPWL